MGWFYGHKPVGESVAAYMAREFPSIEFLETSVVKFHTFYAAYRRRDDPTGRVWAMVSPIAFAPREHFNFGYKGSDESDGPYETDCPARIFSLLTPLSGDEGGYAAAWRERVRARLNQKRGRVTLSHGDRVQLVTPLSFGSYGVHDTFTVIKDGRRVRFRMENGVGCQITRWAEREYRVLPAR